jgi:hypothetical protein
VQIAEQGQAEPHVGARQQLRAEADLVPAFAAPSDRAQAQGPGKADQHEGAEEDEPGPLQRDDATEQP